MSKQFYTNSILPIPLLLLLLGVVCKVLAQALNFSKSVANITITGDGTTALQGDVLLPMMHPPAGGATPFINPVNSINSINSINLINLPLINLLTC